MLPDGEYLKRYETGCSGAASDALVLPGGVAFTDEVKLVRNGNWLRTSRSPESGSGFAGLREPSFPGTVQPYQ